MHMLILKCLIQHNQYPYHSLSTKSINSRYIEFDTYIDFDTIISK